MLNLDSTNTDQNNTLIANQTNDTASANKVNLGQKIVEIFKKNDIENKINPQKLKMLAIVSSYKKEQDPDTSIYDRLVDIIACCQDEKQDSLPKALKSFLTANRISSSAVDAQKYIEDIKKLYQANPNNKNDSILNQYKLEEQMIINDIMHESKRQDIYTWQMKMRVFSK